jgi:hypothetical protein
MNEKLEAIRQACIKANPEIVELKFGCQLSLLGRRYAVFGQCLNVWQIVSIERDLFHSTSLPNGADTFGVNAIYGRPIRLSDVLLAMNVQLFKDSWDLPVLDYDGSKIIALWNLRKDDLTQQSPETIDFLYDLLKEN